MDKNDPKYDRLKLTEERLKDIATDTRNVATLPSPLGRVLKETIRPNGMKLTKISVPFGAIGIIYEARPNVRKRRRLFQPGHYLCYSRSTKRIQYQSTYCRATPSR